MSLFSSNNVVMKDKSSVTASSGDNWPEVGTIKAFEDGKVYEWVYNDGTADLYPARGCVIENGSGATIGHVAASNATGTEFLYGVCRHNTIPAGSYGWVVKRGLTEVEMEADNSGVSGALLALAADGEFAFKSNSTGYPTPGVGQLMESAASGASALAYISVY